MFSKSLILALALCLAIASVPAYGQDCSDLGGNVASACGAFQAAVAGNGGTNPSNDTITQEVSSSSTKVSSSCCQAFQPFLAASCRCNPTTESLISSFNLNDQSFQSIIYAAAIACKQSQGITLYDPQFGASCNNGVASGSR
ncbi:hypothetical protein WJX73_005300 [Symbiochloris irregularis]|uniref:Bifunctional inhibitor/plant lipid transfer protein/seed storage helical domain-containing protein n=1 Tax=Symbiochloris irregularis TaxID=706552 RepID=A0AAW1NPF8_9CHLO